jgi:hypothetical protein
MTTELVTLINLTLIRVIVPIAVTCSLGMLLSRWEARHAGV